MLGAEVVVVQSPSIGLGEDNRLASIRVQSFEHG
jgi:hypothetical protein